MMKRILITGGAGFIGSNFIRYMLNKYPDYKIVNLDKLTYCGNLDNLKDIENNPRYEFIKGDICDKQTVEKALSGCDIIINFAAESHVDRSIKEPSEFIQTNIYGTHVLLEAAKENKVSLFYQISTDEVYGSREKGFFKETDALTPSSPYSASKAAADHLAHSYYMTYKLPVIITRTTNNFGPSQYPEKIIPLFITNLLEDKKVPVYGDGQNVRDWIYVLDNVRAIDFVIHKGEIGEIYNIAGNNELKNLELTKLILTMLGKNKDAIEFVKDRLGHDLRYAVDATKLNRLGWKLRYNFKQALTDTLKWYENNQKWWSVLK